MKDNFNFLFKNKTIFNELVKDSDFIHFLSVIILESKYKIPSSYIKSVFNKTKTSNSKELDEKNKINYLKNMNYLKDFINNKDDYMIDFLFVESKKHTLPNQDPFLFIQTYLEDTIEKNNIETLLNYFLKYSKNKDNMIFYMGQNQENIYNILYSFAERDKDFILKNHTITTLKAPFIIKEFFPEEETNILNFTSYNALFSEIQHQIREHRNITTYNPFLDFEEMQKQFKKSNIKIKNLINNTKAWDISIQENYLHTQISNGKIFSYIQEPHFLLFKLILDVFPNYQNKKVEIPPFSDSNYETIMFFSFLKEQVNCNTNINEIKNDLTTFFINKQSLINLNQALQLLNNKFSNEFQQSIIEHLILDYKLNTSLKPKNIQI